MRKSKKKKNYDIYISPAKRRLYRTRKILFTVSIMTLILNESIIAVCDASMMKNDLSIILLSILFAVIQFVDDRKANWEWGYIIFLSALSFLLSALSVFTSELLFMIYMWVGELVFFLGITLLLLRKKNKN